MMNILEMKNITKSFFGVTVLHGVDFEVRQGEVHALLGENGAGKSTLMNILGGVYTRDSGQVKVDGRQMDNITIKSAETAGIAFVHQELNVINDLKVYENLFLNKEITNRVRKLKKKEMITKTQKLFESLGVDIDPQVLVSELDTGKKQLLEIAKAIFAEAKLFILDEPTTALNNDEIEHLFGIIRGLKEKGKSFIFISHKMPEIFAIADRYTVLRNGYLVDSGDIKDTDPEQVAKEMVGEGYINSDIYEERNLGEKVLEIKNLSGKGFENINLTLRKGEVVGFTGLQGAGSSELMQCIFGVYHPTSGSITAFGRDVTNSGIHGTMKDRVAMLAANRKENSVISDMTILENTYIAEHTLSAKQFRINNKKELAKYSDFKKMLSIKAGSPADPLLSLSGGNQQKVILARWLNTQADLLLLDNPTQGIDVGSKAEIYRLILELAGAGKTIIVNTLEIPEIQKVADRCVVFYHGSVHAILKREEITEEKVMLYATNAIVKQEQGVQNDE